MGVVFDKSAVLIKLYQPCPGKNEHISSIPSTTACYLGSEGFFASLRRDGFLYSLTTASLAVVRLLRWYSAPTVNLKISSFPGKSTATAPPAKSSSPGWSSTPSSLPSPAACRRPKRRR